MCSGEHSHVTIHVHRIISDCPQLRPYATHPHPPHPRPVPDLVYESVLRVPIVEVGAVLRLIPQHGGGVQALGQDCRVVRGTGM